MASSSATSPKRPKQERHFQKDWQLKWPWIDYKEDQGAMWCKLCVAHKKKNTMTEGCTNFRTTTIERHNKSVDHQRAVQDDVSSKSMAKILTSNVDRNDAAILHALKTVYFVAKNDIAMNKFGEFIDFLIYQGCKGIEQLSQTYRSHCVTDDMQKCIFDVIMEDISTKLRQADFISLLTDESCDISNLKKLSVYAKISSKCRTETFFVENVEVKDGKANTITTALIELIDKMHLHTSKVIGLGTDGASVSKEIFVLMSFILVKPLLMGYFTRNILLYHALWNIGEPSLHHFTSPVHCNLYGITDFIHFFTYFCLCIHTSTYNFSGALLVAN